VSTEDVDVYKLLSHGSGKVFSQKPDLFFPTITELHYSDGFIDRYFLKSASDKYSSIIEVTQIEFLSFEQNPFYKRASVRWKLTGPLDNVTRNGIVEDVGVIEYNHTQLKNAENSIDGLLQKFSDLMQFYKAD
jgi:hypothetical protein